MAQLRQDYHLIKEKNAEVVIVGPDSTNAFRKYWDENNLPFIGLADPKHRVLKLFGQEVNIFKFGRMPAQVIIDMDGIVRSAHYGHEMSDIPTTQEILEILDELNS
jgi:peroxiredoxin Q/BCP